ncbi:MAG: hypothetical protein KDA61_16765 [Planctomycetales bacterium]|nr:hypothetical protein [Planctomycetales bacterium]
MEPRGDVAIAGIAPRRAPRDRSFLASGGPLMVRRAEASRLGNGAALPPLGDVVLSAPASPHGTPQPRGRWCVCRAAQRDPADALPAVAGWTGLI